MNPLIGLEQGKVKLENYSSQWDSIYQEEERLLGNVLGNVYITIAHIGSTAIPGIRSKPIIDILLVMPYDYNHELMLKKLSGAGYCVSDHQLHEGIFFMKGSETIQTHHLHLMRDGQDWQGYIFFRDYLRQNPEQARAYEMLKLDLEDKYKLERALYTAAKRSFINGILERMPK